MTSDDKTETPIPRGQFAGGILMAVGVVTIVGALGSSFSRPASTTVHGAVLYLGMIVVFAGLIIYAASTIITRIEREIEKKSDENIIVVGHLTDRVEATDLVLRQLSAAPTVRLEEARREMRATEAAMLDAVEAGNQETKRAVEVSTKALEGRLDELELLVRDELTLVRDAFEAGVRIGAMQREAHEGEAAPDGGPSNVVAMPNPAIYQLGIAEGERRARDGRDKPK